MLGRKSKVKSDLPRPVGQMLAVLDDLWLAYGVARNGGLSPDAALDAAVAHMLDADGTAEVLAFLRGDLDDSYRLSGDRAGQSVRRDMVEQGEVIYAKLRRLPVWPTPAGPGDDPPDPAEAQ